MPNLATVGRFIAHNPSSIAGIGAGVGAAANVGREALSASPDKNYMGAATRGAVLGGLAGGALGAGGRAARDTMLLRPELRGAGEIAKATVQRAGQGVSNFAQRQLHGLTGYGSGNQAYLDRIGMAGSNTSAAKARLLNLRADDQLAHMRTPGWNRNWASEHNIHNEAVSKIHDNLHGAVSGLAQEGEIGDRMRNLGMTSAPGAVKAMVTNPREASKAIWDQLRGGGRLGVAAGVGLPVAMTAASLSKGDESATGGQTMGEKLLRGGANVGGGLLFGGLPMVSNMVAGGLVESAAGRAGRALTPPRPTIADAQTRIG